MKPGLPPYSRKDALYHGPVSIYSGPVARRNQPSMILAFNDAGAGVVGITGFGTAPGTFTRATTAMTVTRDNQYLLLPGTATNYASTPDSVANSISGDIDIKAYVALEDWTPAATNDILSKRQAAGQISYQLRILSPTGIIRGLWSEDGTAALTADSTVAPTVSDRAYLWVRWTMDVDNGASGRTSRFYTSTDYNPITDTGTWTQLGADVTTANVTSIFNSTSIVEVGSALAGTSTPVNGKISYADVRNVIGGGLSTIVLKFDPKRDAAYLATTWNATGTTTEAWTITQTAPNPAALVQAELISVASGSPRSYYDPTTGAYLGYLAEGSRQNLCLRSQEFDSATWTKTTSSITSTSVVSPDGTATSDTLTEDATAGSLHYMTEGFTFTNVVHTVSVFAKASGRTWFRLMEFDGTTVFAAYFNLAGAGTVGVLTNATATIKAYPNGWYLCTVTSNAALAAAAGTVQIRLASADNTDTYNGDGVSGVSFWGAQLEAAAFASTYIPTTTVAVTRNADVLTYPLTGWFNAATGTMFAEYTPFVLDANAHQAFGLNDGTSNEVMYLGNVSSSRAVVIDGGVLQSNISGTTPVVGTKYKEAAVYAVNDFAISKDGGAVVTDTSGTLPTVNICSIGVGEAGAASLYGVISSIRYWPVRLSNTTLQALTA